MATAQIKDCSICLNGQDLLLAGVVVAPMFGRGRISLEISKIQVPVDRRDP
jgi:hypothetical protein